MKKDFLPRWPSQKNETTPERISPAHEAVFAQTQLVESLSIFRAQLDTTPAQEKALEVVITEDARHLAAQLVPSPIADKLSLPQTNSTEFIQPSLPDAYLLASALDATADPIINDTLRYILEYEPPAFSEPLQQAYDKAAISGDPVMVECRRIESKEDLRLDPLIQEWVNANFNDD
jgi:hypothetical protein